MDNVTKAWIGPLPPDSQYLKPYRMYYVQNGVEKNWDLLKVHDSVAIIIYNAERKKLVFVRQFRPAVFHDIVYSSGGSLKEVDLEKFSPQLGITTEMCAGIVDKKKSWVEIAREEVLEECGYDVCVDRLEEVLTYRAGVGSHGATQKMYYCEVTDADKSESGGGVDDEVIEVMEHSLEEAKRMICAGATNNSPPGCLLGILWFFM
ncbi:uridine diphosphate glucose pyrophosphatase NUDT14-like, partial [Teleopsis dalmanni]